MFLVIFRKIVAIMALITLPLGLVASENAALISRGATIKVNCNHAKPLNTSYASPSQIISDTKPGGPIINDLGSATMEVKLPLALTVEKIGIKSTDYKNGMAMVKEFEVEVVGGETKTFTMEQDANKIQFFSISGQSDTLLFRVKSIYPAINGKGTLYGTIANVQVIVEESLDDLFSMPSTTVSSNVATVLRTPNLDKAAFLGVVGTPRKATAHPNTIWDSEDIAMFKKEIETIPAAQKAYKGIVAFANQAVKNKIVVPDEPDDGVNGKLASQHTKVATGIANLGIAYALSGNEDFAKEAARLLSDLADRFPGWPVHSHPKMKHDSSKWSWQRLGDAIWLIPAAWGYDLIKSSPSLSDEQRKHIEDDFVMACVKGILRSNSIIAAATNWSVITTAAVMTGAKACDDEKYYNMAINGLGGTNRKYPDFNNGGVYFHIDAGLDDDGLWGEGAMGYQFMAMRGLIVMAEILWHDGVDIYSYKDGRLKMIFDSPIWYAYPKGESAPAVHDSGSISLFNRDSHLYQYAMRRYGDKTYNAILSKISSSFESVYNLFLPAASYQEVKAVDLPRIPSIHFPGVGFTIGRTGDGEDEKYLFLDYGPNRSHGHADKLNFNLFGLGQELIGESGSAWYTTDVYNNYCPYSLAHNTITANETTQIKTGGKLEAFGSQGDISLVRASCDSAIPGVMLDRTLLMSGDRVYDIFRADSKLVHTLDLPFHGSGKMEQHLADQAWADHPGEIKMYKYFTDTVSQKTDHHWTCSFNVKNGTLNLTTIGEKGTEVVFGNTPKSGVDMPTVMTRRKAKQTVFASGLDMIPQGKEASIQSLEKLLPSSGEGYALKATLKSGEVEWLFVNFVEKELNVGEWSTDARIVFLRLRGSDVQRFLMSGGHYLKAGALQLESQSPALVIYENVKPGLSLLSNQSDQDIQLNLKGLKGLDHWAELDHQGNRGSLQEIDIHNISLNLGAQHQGEFLMGEQPTTADYRQKLRNEKVAIMMDNDRKLKLAMEQEVNAQSKAATQFQLHAEDTVLIQAADFKEQMGGNVTVTATKTASFGSAIVGWNDPQHTLIYKAQIKKEGYYQLVLKYCIEGGSVLRRIEIDGNVPSTDYPEIELETTGGWSNGADNWEYFTIPWPKVGKPYLYHLTPGEHEIRLINLEGGGSNIDYLVLLPQGLEPKKDLLEKN